MFVVVCCVVVAGCDDGVVGLLVGVGELVLSLVEGPRGKLAVFKGCSDVFKLLVHSVLG